MMPDRLPEQRPRRLAISGLENERAEIVERGEIGGVAADEFEIIALGFFEAALFAQEPGTLIERAGGVRIAGQDAVERVQTRPVVGSRRLLAHG